MSQHEDYGESTGKWSPQQIKTYRQRKLDREKYARLTDIISGLPRDPDQEDWERYMEKAESSVSRQRETEDVPASPVNSAEIVQTLGIRQKWALIHDPTNSMLVPAKVIQDTGTGVNFISPKLVASCHLNPTRVARITHQAMSGHKFESNEWVEVMWIGKNNKPGTNWFYIAPHDAPVDLVVGTYFLEKNPDAFMDSVVNTEPSLFAVQTSVTAQEQAQIEANRKQAQDEEAALERQRQERRKR